MVKYHCIEFWKENEKFYKKIHDDDHEKGGAEVEITKEKFNELSEIIENDKC